METLKNYVNWKLAHSDKTATAEGYPLVMENCKANKRMKQLQVYGDCFQRLGSKNLLPYPYYKTTATINGVTFTDNGDGSITVNGTATASAVFYLYMNNTTLIPGIKRGDMVAGTLYSDQEWDASVEKLMVVLNYYNAATTMKDGVILNSSLRARTFAITDDWYGMGFYILVLKGGVVNNITLRVQIELGTTSTEYEPYVLSPSPDYPSEIETVGDLTTKNLFNMETMLPEQGWIKQDDGSYYVESAATPYQQVLWKNTENYSGQLKILYQFKYLKASSESPVGLYIQIKYTDGTTQAIYLHTGRFDADTWYVPTDSRTITDSSKTVSQIIWAYGTGSNSTWVKDIIITKDINITEYEPYHKYKIPVALRGKNLLSNSDWMSGTHSDGFIEKTEVDYITEYTQNSISFNLAAWNGVSSPRFKKDMVKRIVFKINQNQVNSDDGYINFYIMIQGYDNDNNKIGKIGIHNNAIANTEYVFDFSTITSYNWYINSTQFSFCILARNNPLSNLMVYDIAYYADTDTTDYEPYVEPITQNIYLDEPLRKIEDYADYIDFKNKRVIRNVKEITFENKTFNEYSYGTTLDNTYHFNIRNMGCIYRTPMFCNIMKAGSINMNSDANDTFFTSMYSNVANGGIYLQIEKALIDDYSGESNVEKLKLFLLEKQAKLLYCVSEYTEEDISCQLPKTLAKTTVIEVDTTLLPSNIKGKYIIK